MNLYILTGLSVTLATAIFAILVSRLTFRVHGRDSAADSFEDFSIETYRPMERLLNENDYRFLAKQPGYSPAIGRKLRAEHIKIFRIYLHDMVGDFNSLVKLAKLMLIHGPQDRPDLAMAISRIQYQFYWNVVLTEVQLVLSPWTGARATASGLINLLDTARSSVQESRMMIGQANFTGLSTDS